MADVNQPWTQFQASAAHSGYLAGTVVPSEIKSSWSASAASLGYSTLATNVAIDAAGQVYVSAVSTNAATGSTSAVIAMSASGSVNWSHQIPIDWFGGLSAPALGNGMVYVDRLGESNVTGAILPTLYGFSAGSGSQVFATSYQGQSDVGGQPTVSGSRVYLSSGTYGGFASYSAVTGAALATYSVPFQEGWCAAADASHAYLYFPAAAQNPGPLTGTLYIFGTPTTSTVQNPPDFYSALDQSSNVCLGSQNDALVITSSYGGPWQLVSFNLGSDTVQWRTNLSFTYPYGTFLADDSGKLAAHNGIIYADDGSQLSLFSEASGAHLADWSPPDGGLLYGNPIITDNLIFAQSSAATYGIDASTLATVWSTPMTGQMALGGDELVINNGSAVEVFAVPEPGCGEVMLAAVWVMSPRPRRRRERRPCSRGCPVTTERWRAL
jgi:hypothetical protein